MRAHRGGKGGGGERGVGGGKSPLTSSLSRWFHSLFTLMDSRDDGSTKSAWRMKRRPYEATGRNANTGCCCALRVPSPSARAAQTSVSSTATPRRGTPGCTARRTTRKECGAWPPPQWTCTTPLGLSWRRISRRVPASASHTVTCRSLRRKSSMEGSMLRAAARDSAPGQGWGVQAQRTTVCVCSWPDSQEREGGGRPPGGNGREGGLATYSSN